MKRLVSILLFVFAVATGFAQSSTPDYIQKAKVGLTQYYPQFKDYFEPIFAEYNKLSVNTHNIFYSKIYDNFDTFKEELTTERDKCATILTAIDELLGDKKFKNSKKQVDSPEGDDLINGIADEISFDTDARIAKEIRDNEEKTAKIKELRAKLESNKDNPEGLLNTIDSCFEVFEIEEVKANSTIQEIIKYYISISHKINHTPSPLGQKFIDEYNRITKSK